jgi:hypothetical protein
VKAMLCEAINLEDYFMILLGLLNKGKIPSSACGVWRVFLFLAQA